MLRTVEVTARVEGSREELFSIVTDYSRYDTWMPGIESAWVLAEEGDVTLAEVRAPGFSDHGINLELVHSPPGSVVFRQIDGLDQPEISGRWELGETEPGVRVATVLVSTRLSIETPVLALGSRRRLRAALAAGLDALGARRRLLASARPEPAARKQKLLELVREADGLRLWAMGESYFLPKTPPPGRG